ncbi:hypothetical protein HHK36_029666 [Tetracentron sinense]|uniref:Glycosyltransferase n=1 Tax=Tetracentron sinense TaxID=13715 RepID=A0A835CZU6_TETSI|nr:hypothetical protein HHK36_029666 [Tetracentron sinense]
MNPLLQFAKRLASKGLKATIATTHYTVRSIDAPNVNVEPISDGFDEGGFKQAPDLDTYLENFIAAGSKSLSELIQKLKRSSNPVSCIVYDSMLPWALYVAKEHGIYGAAFFTTSAAVSTIYYQVHEGLLSFSSTTEGPHILSVPGFPKMGYGDMASFLAVPVSYPAYLASVMDQFSNLEMADWVLGNTFEDLESQVAKEMTMPRPMMMIGPMIPSAYLDGRINGDTGYGANLWKPVRDKCLKWLGTKPPNSVIYVSFGSMAELTATQTEELAMGLKGSCKHFLWVLKESEHCMLPNRFIDSTEETMLLVTWCDQLEVLAHQATGCFVTHCGWNSTLEGLSLGVPMVAVPQWTDQPTNAKFMEEVWRVGVRAKMGEKGIVGREEFQLSIREVMEGERSEEFKKNASKWRELAKEAIGEAGSSDKNIDKFVGYLSSD